MQALTEQVTFLRMLWGKSLLSGDQEGGTDVTNFIFLGENLKSKFITEAVLVKTVIYQMLGIFEMLNRIVIYLRMGGRTAGQASLWVVKGTEIKDDKSERGSVTQYNVN